MRTRNTRGIVAPAAIALLAIGFLAVVADQVSAQTPYVPYYGKNRIRYDDFKWKIYTTDHFEIYYYPEVEPHLERVTPTPRAPISRSART